MTDTSMNGMDEPDSPDRVLDLDGATIEAPGDVPVDAAPAEPPADEAPADETTTARPEEEQPG